MCRQGARPSLTVFWRDSVGILIEGWVRFCGAAANVCPGEADGLSSPESRPGAKPRSGVRMLPTAQAVGRKPWKAVSPAGTKESLAHSFLELRFGGRRG